IPARLCWRVSRPSRRQPLSTGLTGALRPGNVTIWIALGLRTEYHRTRGDCVYRPKDSMANKFPSSSQDKTADLLLAIGAGFLINLILGAAIPEVGPFVAGLVAGVIVKTGPFRGGVAGFLAGTLGELASMTLWVLTNLVVYPNALVPYAFQSAFAIVTAVSAVLALSGGIIGGVVSLQHWPRIHHFLMGGRIGLPLHLHHSPQARIDKKEADFLLSSSILCVGPNLH